MRVLPVAGLRTQLWVGPAGLEPTTSAVEARRFAGLRIIAAPAVDDERAAA